MLTVAPRSIRHSSGSTSFPVELDLNSYYKGIGDPINRKIEIIVNVFGVEINVGGTNLIKINFEDGSFTIGTGANQLSASDSVLTFNGKKVMLEE